MTLTDLRILCTALGFTAVAMQGGTPPKKESALRAAGFASLIEEFCRTSLPEAFGESGEDTADPTYESKLAVSERMATAIAEIYRKTGGCLPHDLVAKGFTHEEVDRHWAMAKALAHVQLKIMDS